MFTSLGKILKRKIDDSRVLSRQVISKISTNVWPQVSTCYKTYKQFRFYLGLAAEATIVPRLLRRT